jgi:hypothetical protein
MNTKLYPETLPARTATLLGKIVLAKPRFLTDFYLSGGTALSLQLGHRESEDLDFFDQKPFDPKILQIELEKLGKLVSVELSENTLNSTLDGVKLQFLGYPYPMLEKLSDYHGIQLSSVLDIACTKLQTIGMRGSKKDFMDLDVIFGQYSLAELLKTMPKKYPGVEYSVPHILKSLVYFDDADEEPMPRLHKDIEWDEVKERMVEVVKTVRLQG